METILIVSDNLPTSINGVVTTYKSIEKCAINRGYNFVYLDPTSFKHFSAPTYPEVKLSIPWGIGRKILKVNPTYIHISTEGPVGWAAKIWCDLKGIKYTTAYHTKFPEYIQEKFRIPVSITYGILRIFHKFSRRVLVTNSSMVSELKHRGFSNLVVWSRGVDQSGFNPAGRVANLASKPVLLCVSRASPEKGLDDFCALKTTGTKLLVGDGPYLEYLKKTYPDVIYVGYKQGEKLRHYYANADVFVFPSKSDTFGVVMIESMACGTPVAAYPVTGPIDVIVPGINGVLHDDLSVAIKGALMLDRGKVAASSKEFSWDSCTTIFESNLVKIPVQ